MLNPVTADLPDSTARRGGGAVRRGSFMDEVRGSPSLFAFVIVVLTSLAMRVAEPSDESQGTPEWTVGLALIWRVGQDRARRDTVTDERDRNGRHAQASHD